MNVVSQVQDRTLVVLHPFDSIETNKYIVDPEVIFFLNNKENIWALSMSIPSREVVPVEDVKDIWNFPIVIKTLTGASSDWVKIIYSKWDLIEAWNTFTDEEFLILEEYIDIRKNYNIQLSISKNGEITILWASLQDINEVGVYDGNIIPAQCDIPQVAESIVYEIGANAHRKWFFGLCWLDIIEGSDSRYYFIDGNFRINGSTSSLLLKDKIVGETWCNLLKFGSFQSDFWWVWDLITACKTSVYFLSMYPNASSWKIWWYAILPHNDAWFLAEKRRELMWKWLIM